MNCSHMFKTSAKTAFLFVCMGGIGMVVRTVGKFDNSSKEMK